MIRLPDLREALRDLPVDQALLTPSIAGLAVRFSFLKASSDARRSVMSDTE